jgi:hypothetical protein
MSLIEPQEGVAVGLGLHRSLGGDDLACARPVVDDDLLAERLRKPLRQHARRDVGHAARRVGKEHLDRLGRIVLREGSGPEALERTGYFSPQSLSWSLRITPK